MNMIKGGTNIMNTKHHFLLKLVKGIGNAGLYKMRIMQEIPCPGWFHQPDRPKQLQTHRRRKEESH